MRICRPKSKNMDFPLQNSHKRVWRGGASYPQFAIVVLHLRTVPSSAARCFAPADFASLRVLGASAASRPPISHRAVFGGPVFRPCGLRFAPCPQFGMVVPHLRTVPPLAARCSVAAHCALLRALATSALRAFGCSQARLRLSLVPTIRNSRLSVQHGRSASFASSLAALPASLGSSAAIAPSIRNGRLASSHRPALTLARCSVAAHCASLRVLATPALRASDVWPSRLSVQHGRLSAFAKLT